MWERYIDRHPLGMKDARSISIDSLLWLVVCTSLETVCSNGPSGAIDLCLRKLCYRQDGGSVFWPHIRSTAMRGRIDMYFRLVKLGKDLRSCGWLDPFQKTKRATKMK